MAFMTWDDRFDLGVPPMNDEHKKLIALMNQLHDLRDGKAGKEKTKAAVEALEKYTAHHFADEEKYMESIGYKDIALHKRIHATLIAQLADHRKTLLAGDGRVPDSFFKFLQFWLSAHICGVDMKYSARGAR